MFIDFEMERREVSYRRQGYVDDNTICKDVHVDADTGDGTRWSSVMGM